VEVRDLLACGLSQQVAVRYQLLNAEFDRRATAAWTGEGVK
jgi:hypothetical protein